ncbi:sensor histidine kinase [Evansella tamaricis]|uniref:Sensor histidine kinase n=1 Tax=Evansella tamaricis TaxID=2069301 RepID=A0ABS6JH56_9BACI|nr:sensor histidine kinase [Evansella tamaricis]MBU9712963.1 sensor histidine kinase [Evansella tamaricis]
MLPSINLFNNIRLRNKLLILYIFCVFFPIVVTNIVFYNVTTTNIKNQKMHDVNLVLDQITYDFISVVDQAVGISAGFYTDSRLYEYFDENYERTIDYIEAYDFYLREYNSYTPLYYSIQDISFYTNNPTVLYAGGVRPITDITKEQEWFAELSNVNHPIFVRTNPIVESEVFSLIRELDYYKDLNERKKIIKIDLNPVTIRQIFNNVTFQGNVYLINNDRVVEYSTDNRFDWREENIHYNDIQRQLGDDMIQLDERYLPHNYLEGWRIVGTISEADILEELYQSERFIFLLASLNFLIPTLIIVLISRSLHVRIARLLHFMKKMKNQNFEEIPYHKDEDEIGELTNEFNNMTRTIKKLINEVYIANIQKKDLELKEKQAQLSALQSQINPHFLFNALETIRMRSLIKGEKETAKIIQNMAKIFRNSLTWGKDWVTVEEELALIECFLEIQKYRFGEKLEYTIEIEDGTYENIIPNMAFLPFVENASIHGIESVKEKGHIHITIKQIDSEVIFRIVDNGAGMERDKLDRILNNLKNEESMGENVGIKNVYYRLKLYYSNNFSFSIKSNPGKGTIVEIKLPREGK